MKKQMMLWLGLAAVAGAAVYLLKNRQKDGEALPNQGIYRLYAPVYDRLFGPLYAAARRRTAELLALQPGETLLIPGIGTGLDLDNIPAGVEVLGVDISAEMLAQAEARVTGENIRLVRMDGQHLDLPDDSYDAVLLSLIVSVAPDGRAIFDEAWRVLKPGGRLVLFDKFAALRGDLNLLRRALGAFFRLLGTDINRRLMDITGQRADMRVEVNEDSLLGGLYRVLRFRKLPSRA